MSTVSRGTETIDTAWPIGSSEATIIVSVLNEFRPTPESTPISSIVKRPRSVDGGGGANTTGGGRRPCSSRTLGWVMNVGGYGTSTAAKTVEAASRGTSVRDAGEMLRPRTTQGPTPFT